MQQKFDFTILLIAFFIGVSYQAKAQVISGKVTFVTSQNVYVKFGNTRLINIGDTLEISGLKKPCLIVKNKSTSSCVCIPLNDCEVNVDDEIIHIQKTKNPDKTTSEKIIAQNTDRGKDSTKNKITEVKNSIYEEYIKGKISLSGSSNISESRDDKSRLLSRFSLNANHINNSAFSFETYLNYRQNFPDPSDSNPNNKNFKIYNLAIKYDINPATSITAGRKINPKMSSVGAIDGIQIERFFGKNYMGVISGFRPDIYNYGLDLNLFEYGGYIGRITDSENFRSQTTLGILEQKYSGKTDRRYSYFQHSSTVFKKLNLFSSMEFDIYNKMSDSVGNDIRLTNLYVSARYRFNRVFDLTLSYDSRKRIVYYESYQTEIERILDDDIARQGFRIRANVKPIKYLSFGLSLSKRFQSDTQNESNNIYAYSSLSRIPGIGGRLSINYNLNSTNYLENKALTFRHSRTLLKEKLDADLFYRQVNYNFLNSERMDLKNHYYGTSLSYRINKKLLFRVSCELSDYNQDKNYRLNAEIVKRFYTNKNKK